MRLIIKKSLIVISICLTASCSQEPLEFADTIYRDGNIITINDAQPSAQAIAIKDGLILAVGSDAEVLKYKKR